VARFISNSFFKCNNNVVYSVLTKSKLQVIFCKLHKDKDNLEFDFQIVGLERNRLVAFSIHTAQICAQYTSFGRLIFYHWIKKEHDFIMVYQHYIFFSFSSTLQSSPSWTAVDPPPLNHRLCFFYL
jgi:hypothetical protein